MGSVETGNMGEQTLMQDKKSTKSVPERQRITFRRTFDSSQGLQSSTAALCLFFIDSAGNAAIEPTEGNLGAIHVGMAAIPGGLGGSHSSSQSSQQPGVGSRLRRTTHTHTPTRARNRQTFRSERGWVNLLHAAAPLETMYAGSYEYCPRKAGGSDAGTLD